MYKKTGAILAAGLLLGLAGCGKSETPPLSGQDQIYEDSMNAGLAKVRSNPELKRLQTLREVPSVINASIKNTLSNNSPAAEYYTINLKSAIASITAPDGDPEKYLLDKKQIDGLERLLSEYALTVYEDQPYWPASDNYCTMIELFDFSVDYDKGSYREYGATHYPEGWDEFIQSLKELIISEKEAAEYVYEVTGRVNEFIPEYRYQATGIASGTDEWSVGYITGLTVYNENGRIPLHADFTDGKPGNPIYFNMMDTMGLHILDVNFDGYKDVIILKDFGGAHSNTWYDCWLWNPVTWVFEHCPSFAEICNPAIDHEKQCVYSAGGSGTDHGYYIYRYVDYEFTVTNDLLWRHSTNVEPVEGQEMTARSAKGIYLKEQQLVDGEMQLVREGFFPEDEADLLLMQYGSGEPWQLDSPRWYMYGGHHADPWLE